MTDRATSPLCFGWTRDETRRRQVEAGALMTPAQRLVILEEMLDEVLPMLGRARRTDPDTVDPRTSQ